MTGLLTTLCEKFKIDPLPRPVTSRVGDGSGDDVGLKPVMNTHMTGLASTLVSQVELRGSVTQHSKLGYSRLHYKAL